MAIWAPATVSSAEIGSRSSADIRVPSDRSATTASIFPSAAPRLIRGISAVSTELPRTP
jgi:hypothetical protein